MALVRCPACGRVASGSTCFACGASLDDTAAGPPPVTHADPIPPRATPARGNAGPESWAVRAPGQGFDVFHAKPAAVPASFDDFAAPVVEGLAFGGGDDVPVVQGAALVEPFDAGPPPPDPFAPFKRSTPAHGHALDRPPASPLHAPLDDGLAIEMTDGFDVEGPLPGAAVGIEMTDGVGFDAPLPGTPSGIEMTDGFDVDLPPSMNAAPAEGGFDLSFDVDPAASSFGDLAQAAAAAATFDNDEIETEVLDERPRAATPPAPPPDDDEDSTAIIRSPASAAHGAAPTERTPPALPEDAFDFGGLDDVPMPPALDDEMPPVDVVDESTLPLVARPPLPSANDAAVSTPTLAAPAASESDISSSEIDFGDLSLDIGTGETALSFDDPLPELPDLSDPIFDAPSSSGERTMPMGSVPGEAGISLEEFDDLEVALPSAAAASTVRASLDARGDMAPHSTHAQPTRMAPPLDDTLDAAGASMVRIDRAYAKELAAKVGALAEEMEGDGKFEAAALLYDVQTALDGEG